MINKIVADDVVEQSRQVLGIIASEGVAIIPLDVAYAIVGNSKKSIEAIFKCKNRSFGKPSGMFSNYELLKEIQIMDSWKHDLIKAVIFDNNLPMSTVAPFKRDHPMFKNVDGWVLKNSTKTGGNFFVMDLLRPDSIENAHKIVTEYAADESKQLRIDFYNSLLASYTTEEVQKQLLESKIENFNIQQITDRHFIVFGSMFA